MIKATRCRCCPQSTKEETTRENPLGNIFTKAKCTFTRDFGCLAGGVKESSKRRFEIECVVCCLKLFRWSAAFEIQLDSSQRVWFFFKHQNQNLKKTYQICFLEHGMEVLVLGKAPFSQNILLLLK